MPSQHSTIDEWVDALERAGKRPRKQGKRLEGAMS